MNKTPALVLGASSPLGRRIIERLDGPIRVSRKPRDGWICADVKRPESLANLPPAETVFSASHVWLLPHALPTLLANGAKRVVAFSSTSRFTKIDSPEAKERDTVIALTEGEERTIALCEAAGAAWTILRPTMIYAEGEDQNVSRLARVISRFHVFPMAGSGSGRRQPVHADDLAQVAVSCAGVEAAWNKAYNLPGGETLTYRELVGRVFDGLHKPRRVVGVPAALWTLAFAAAKPFVPGATAAMGARMTSDLVFDAGPAQQDLGWAPRRFHPDFQRASS
jgi:nucleoside-diphosphate-sugar epimerase